MRATPWLLGAGAVLTTLGFLLAMLWLPPVSGAAVDEVAVIGGTVVANVQLISQKIFYFHMPVAVVSFVALIAAAYFALRYLMTRDERFDLRERIGMEVSLLFVVMTMITGDLWTRFEWGVWWTWEPRLTTYLILMVIVIAYFILRGAVEDPRRKAAYGAVVTLIALVDVPICFMITRLIPSSIHPVVLREGGMSPEMGGVLGLVIIGMFCIAIGLYLARLAQSQLTERVAALKEALDEQ